MLLSTIWCEVKYSARFSYDKSDAARGVGCDSAHLSRLVTLINSDIVVADKQKEVLSILY